ncbi:hypothetical protein SORBI_3010G100650 [Sorghum bicolor]|uniref:Uncharacterized protein n=1 Tax=Sorghum bicolor TaxID=4558 RepID=A0A1W0VS99_SORBI|nr:hypothetical protein SORBI_3010G100650 [Sorghum bicolor]
MHLLFCCPPSCRCRTPAFLCCLPSSQPNSLMTFSISCETASSTYNTPMQVYLCMR